MVKRTAARWTTWKSKAANWYLSCSDQTWLAGKSLKQMQVWMGKSCVYIYICVNKWGMHFYSSTPRNKCRCLFQDAAVAATSMMFFPALGSLFGADLLWVCSTAANHQANITFWNILNVKTCKKKTLHLNLESGNHRMARHPLIRGAHPGTWWLWLLLMVMSKPAERLFFVEKKIPCCKLSASFLADVKVHRFWSPN